MGAKVVSLLVIGALSTALSLVGSVGGRRLLTARGRPPFADPAVLRTLALACSSSASGRSSVSASASSSPTRSPRCSSRSGSRGSSSRSSGLVARHTGAGVRTSRRTCRSQATARSCNGRQRLAGAEPLAWWAGALVLVAYAAAPRRRRLGADGAPTSATRRTGLGRADATARTSGDSERAAIGWAVDRPRPIDDLTKEAYSPWLTQSPSRRPAGGLRPERVAGGRAVPAVPRRTRTRSTRRGGTFFEDYTPGRGRLGRQRRHAAHRRPATPRRPPTNGSAPARQAPARAAAGRTRPPAPTAPRPPRRRRPRPAAARTAPAPAASTPAPAGSAPARARRRRAPGPSPRHRSRRSRATPRPQGVRPARRRPSDPCAAPRPRRHQHGGQPRGPDRHQRARRPGQAADRQPHRHQQPPRARPRRQGLASPT